jgi:hypothetical protein
MRKITASQPASKSLDLDALRAQFAANAMIRAEADAARAARTPEQVAADDARDAADRAMRDAEQDRAIAALHNYDEAARLRSVAAFKARMAFVDGMD